MLSPSTPKKRKKETFTISFRVDAHHLNQLEKGAAKYGISVHEYARQRLSELLERRDEARLLEDTAATRRSVEGLRSDVAATLEVVLLNTTKAATEEERGRIRDWIDQHLRHGVAGREG